MVLNKTPRGISEKNSPAPWGLETRKREERLTAMESEEAGSVEKGESSILGPGKERLQKKVSKCVNYC